VGALKIGIIVIVVLLIFFIATLVFGALAAWILSRPRKKTYLDNYFFTPFETGVPFEPCGFVNSDGIILRGWWLPGENGAVVIGLGGRLGTKSDLLGVGSYLNKAGYNVLLFDYRDCGESDPGPTSLGELEISDAIAAIDFARSRASGAKIGIVGFSLGASLGIIASSKNLNIDSLICDSPFSSTKGLFARRICPRFPSIAVPSLFPIRFFTKIFYGYEVGDLDVLACASNVQLTKLLVIASARDSVIPVSQQREVFAAASCPKELWEETNAEHCGAYFNDRPLYVKKAIEFFDETLLKNR